jgi:UDP-N-acetylglucosamine--N-acetylmuramyl-(pentapeptide) pyrophosphoryl-undecaprenol N-acetylglucosamine transferase
VEKKPTRIVLAGGGTGGHLYPALSVADELRRRHPHASIIFVGARRGLEQRLVPAAGYALRAFPLGGLQGTRLSRKLVAAFAAGWAVMRCAAWMLRERPDLVIGVGGYASGPAVLAGRLLRVPALVMEQNHFPGATNRFLAPRVNAVCVPSEAAAARMRGRTIVTGNPVRPAFFEAGERPATGVPTLLVSGGSRGARSINRALVAALPALAERRPCPAIAHQTGAADEAEVRVAYRDYPGAHEVAAFFDDMPRRFAAADVIICRAGASTLAELCAAGRPAILVPYPHAADDHQRHNAETLQQAGAALLLDDRALDGPALAAALDGLLIDAGRRLRMGRAARELARPHAAAHIANVADRLIAGRDAGGADVP